MTELNLTFLLKLLFTYMVTNCLFAKIIFSFVQWIHHKLMKLNFAMFLVLSLSSAWLQILWKTYSLWSKNGVLLSDSFAFTKPKSCKQTCSLSAVINVGDLSAFVTEWQGANREWSKIITTNIVWNADWNRTAETRTSLICYGRRVEDS